MPPLQRAARGALDDVVAAGVMRLMATLALLLVALVMLQQVLRAARTPPTATGGWGMALMLAAAALLARLLRRAGRPRAATVGALAMLVAATGVQAVATGVGLHSIVLAGGALAVSLAGLLGSASPAMGLALLHGCGGADGGLARARAAGPVPTPSCTAAAGLVGQLLLTGCGLAGALALSRIVGQSLAYARAGEKRIEALLDIASDWVFEADRATAAW